MYYKLKTNIILPLNIQLKPFFGIKNLLLIVGILLSSLSSWAQVKTTIDTTQIRIGEQVSYRIEVRADSSDIVVFPEGQTFRPMEIISISEIDSTRNQAIYDLVRTYGLTQFDSGSYTIPRQKIRIGNTDYFTDSLRIEVRDVVVDTLTQGLYDIKPLIAVDKPSNTWQTQTWLIVLALIALLAFVLYWFIWRKKPLTEAEEIALLAPYDRAQVALKKLDESPYLMHSELKDYYSELSFIIRRYLDEEVYDRALESTTDELIFRLSILKDGGQIKLSNENINSIKNILKRADLVKFAKSTPDVELAKIDRTTVEKEIDTVKKALPEPTEDELLLDERYKELQQKKKTRQNIFWTATIAILVLAITFAGFVFAFGFDTVKDNMLGNPSKSLLNGTWVKSEYGYPPIYISTPEVLERTEAQPVDELGPAKTSYFSYGNLSSSIHLAVKTTTLNQPDTISIDLLRVVEDGLKTIEANGVTDIITKQDKFVTPNAAEGLKVFGTAQFSRPLKKTSVPGQYVMLNFTSGNILQQVLLIWEVDDQYADQIMDRVLESIELKKKDE